MLFGAAAEHINFFNENSKIEFENLITPDQLKILLRTIHRLLPPDQHHLEGGFELWRKEPLLKPLICGPAFAKIVGQLKNTPQLRFGYSQFLSSECYDNDYSFFSKKSCIKDLICGLCLCLKPAIEAESPFFPQKELSGLFFNIDKEFLLKMPKTTGQYLFIFYANFKARFYKQDDNVMEENFQRLGYHNGDFLKESVNQSYQRIVV